MTDLFLPEPEPRAVRTTVISVDDHLVEPPDVFGGSSRRRWWRRRSPTRVESDAPDVHSPDMTGVVQWRTSDAYALRSGVGDIARGVGS